MKYVTVKFNPWDRRTYTYHCDDDAIAKGDKVTVTTPRDGPKTVTVESVHENKPPFATKAATKFVEESSQ